MSSLRRFGDGVWGLAALSAVVAPLTVEVAVAHRVHWAGVGSGPFWNTVAVPWAGRVWVVLALLGLVGWAASVAPSHPRAGQRALGGLAVGALGALVCVVAALPGWIWIGRLGAASMFQLVSAYGGGAAALLIGGVVAGVAGTLGEALGAGLGAVGGGAVVWAVWGIAVG